MTISSEIEAPDVEPAYVECRLCGSRLQPNVEPDLLEVGADSLRAIARHRCVPRVESRI